MVICQHCIYTKPLHRRDSRYFENVEVDDSIWCTLINESFVDRRDEVLRRKTFHPDD